MTFKAILQDKAGEVLAELVMASWPPLPETVVALAVRDRSLVFEHEPKSFDLLSGRMPEDRFVALKVTTVDRQLDHRLSESRTHLLGVDQAFTMTVERQGLTAPSASPGQQDLDEVLNEAQLDQQRPAYGRHDALMEMRDLKQVLDRALERLGEDYPNYADMDITLPAGHWRQIFKAIGG